MRTSDKLFIQKIISMGAALVTFAVTPWTTADPINVPKLLILSTVAVSILLSSSVLILRSPKSLGTISRYLGLYFTWMIVVIAAAPGWKIQQLFGTEGRNSGLVASFSFLTIFLITAMVSDQVFVRLVWKSLAFVGFSSLIYGYMQYFRADPAPWINPDNPIIGFLGNSNFQSSLLGLCACLTFPGLKKMSKERIKGSLTLLILVLILLQIFLSGAIQGFFVLAAGFFTFLLIEVHSSKFKRFTSYLLAVIVCCAALVGLGLLNIGPLAKFLFSQSVNARYDYWHAAIKMTLDFPTFGVGLDSFGDWYRRSRTLDAMLRRDVTTNSAHNIFLDQFATGGLVLGIFYLGLQIMASYSVVKIIRFRTPSPLMKGIICAWVGYLAQSLISISQIGLAIWGWILSGLIVGIAAHDNPVSSSKKDKSQLSDREVSAKTLLKTFGGAIIGFTIAIPPFVAQANLYQAFKSGSVSQLMSTSTQIGATSKTQVRIALALEQNSFFIESLQVASRVVRNNPNDFEAWSLIYGNKMSSSRERQEAFLNLKRLEPNRDKF
jgi:O-antigen ligase